MDRGPSKSVPDQQSARHASCDRGHDAKPYHDFKAWRISSWFSAERCCSMPLQFPRNCFWVLGNGTWGIQCFWRLGWHHRLHYAWLPFQPSLSPRSSRFMPTTSGGQPPLVFSRVRHGTTARRHRERPVKTAPLPHHPAGPHRAVRDVEVRRGEACRGDQREEMLRTRLRARRLSYHRRR